MTRPNGRKDESLPTKADDTSTRQAMVGISGVVPSRTMRRLKELMESDRELWREGEDSMVPMLDACLAQIAEHDEEPTGEQARREDAFAYVLEVLRNQEEDDESAGDAEEEAAAPEVSDMWP